MSPSLWGALRFLRWLCWPAPEPRVHEHRWVLTESRHPYVGVRMLTWTCQTCPHRELLGLVWPNATNRRTAA